MRAADLALGTTTLAWRYALVQNNRGDMATVYQEATKQRT
jgi:hypothetical protein